MRTVNKIANWIEKPPRGWKKKKQASRLEEILSENEITSPTEEESNAEKV